MRQSTAKINQSAINTYQPVVEKISLLRNQNHLKLLIIMLVPWQDRIRRIQGLTKTIFLSVSDYVCIFHHKFHDGPHYQFLLFQRHE